MKNSSTHPRNLALIGGVSYLIIFFAAIFANFYALEALIQTPLKTVQQDAQFVSLGIMAFLIAVVFEVVVAWVLQEMFKDQLLSFLSTAFRMMHARPSWAWPSLPCNWPSRPKVPKPFYIK